MRPIMAPYLRPDSLPQPDVAVKPEKLPPDVRVRREVARVLARAKVAQDDVDRLADRLAKMLVETSVEVVRGFLVAEAKHAKAKMNIERVAIAKLRRQVRDDRPPADVEARIEAQVAIRDARAKVHGGYAELFRLRATECMPDA